MYLKLNIYFLFNIIYYSFFIKIYYVKLEEISKTHLVILTLFDLSRLSLKKLLRYLNIDNLLSAMFYTIHTYEFYFGTLFILSLFSLKVGFISFFL